MNKQISQETPGEAELIEKVRALGPWFHNIEVAPGIFTRDIAPAPGPQPKNHPVPRWEKVRDALPEDMTGMSVLDAGCSDGYFSIKIAERGASRVLAVDGAAEPIKRIDWVIEHFGLKNVESRVQMLDRTSARKLGKFDLVFAMAVFYHMRDPITGIEMLASLGDRLLLETIVVPDRKDCYFKVKRPGGESGVPKLIPSTACLEMLMRWAGYDKITQLTDDADSRPIYLCERKGSEA